MKWYFYFEGSTAVGPLPLKEIVGRIRAKKIGPYQLIFTEGDTEWRPAVALEELRSELADVPTSRAGGPEWIVLKKSGQHPLGFESLGPLSSDEVREAVASGRIEYTDYIWKNGMAHWRRVATIRDFAPKTAPSHASKPSPELSVQPSSASREELLRSVEVAKPRYEMRPEDPPPKDAEGENLVPDFARAPILRPMQGAPLPEVEVPSVTVTNIRPLESKPKESEAKDPKTFKSKPVEVKTPPDKAMETKPEAAKPIKIQKKKTAPKKQIASALVPWQIGLGLFLVGAVAYKYVSQKQPGEAAVPVPVQVSAAPVPTPAPAPAPEALPAPEPVVIPSPTPEPKTPAVVEKKEVLKKEVAKEKPREKEGPKKKPVHVASKLSIKKDGGAFKIKTDASPGQIVKIEMVGVPGRIVGKSHFSKKFKWTVGEPWSFDKSEWPAGTYQLHASSGPATLDEKVEIGTKEKGFTEDLKSTRKQNYSDFWVEKKRLFYLTRSLSEQLAKDRKPKLKDLDSWSKGALNPELWAELKSIKKDAGSEDVQGRLRALTEKISQLSIYH